MMARVPLRRTAGSRPSYLPPRQNAPRLRERRMRRNYIRAGIGLFLLLLFVWGISMLTYSSLLSVGEIKVVSATSVSSTAIRAYVDSKLDTGGRPFFSPRTVFFLPKKEIEQGLLTTFPDLLTAKVTVATWVRPTLFVEVHERETASTWCTSLVDPRMCYHFDEGGFLFEKSIPTPMIFAGGIASSSNPIGSRYLKDTLADARIILGGIKDLRFVPTAFVAGPADEFALHVQGGAVIRGRFKDGADNFLINLKTVLETEALRGNRETIEYVDLRFGDRIFYKLHTETEKAAE